DPRSLRLNHPLSQGDHGLVSTAVRAVPADGLGLAPGPPACVADRPGLVKLAQLLLGRPDQLDRGEPPARRLHPPVASQDGCDLAHLVRGDWVERVRPWTA